MIEHRHITTSKFEVGRPCISEGQLLHPINKGAIPHITILELHASSTSKLLDLTRSTNIIQGWIQCSCYEGCTPQGMNAPM
jgi:hypothetical protein